MNTFISNTPLTSYVTKTVAADFSAKLFATHEDKTNEHNVSLTILPLTQDFKFYKKKNSTAAKRFDYILTASSPSRTKT